MEYSELHLTNFNCKLILHDTRQMALQYITDVANKANPWSSKPVLTEEDEAFLQRVTSSSEAGQSSAVVLSGTDAQVALMDGAQDIPLPMSPDGDLDRDLPKEKLETENEEGAEKAEEAPATTTSTKKKNRPWSLWMRKGNSTDDTKKVIQFVPTSFIVI